MEKGKEERYLRKIVDADHEGSVIRHFEKRFHDRHSSATSKLLVGSREQRSAFEVCGKGVVETDLNVKTETTKSVLGMDGAG